MVRPFILLAFALEIMAGCESGIPNKLAEQYNDQAARLAMKSKTDSALIYVNRAIAADSTYLTAYENKYEFLYSLKRYKEALATAQLAARRFQWTAHFSFPEGKAFEKLGKLDSAKSSYRKLLESGYFDTRYWSSRMMIARLITVTEGKDRGLEEIKRLIDEYKGKLKHSEFKIILEERNNIATYSGGGILDDFEIERAEGTWYCLHSQLDCEEAADSLENIGINVRGYKSEPVIPGIVKVQIIDKFRDKAIKNGLSECQK
ncbi:MAG TPA: hypothetical protein VL633_02995 [Bacteroidota bacterium]|jgi:tetratricopeptide (TPR) repeat protein|nr:hypothetical protein [Bacteroidota bacterium]